MNIPVIETQSGHAASVTDPAGCTILVEPIAEGWEATYPGARMFGTIYGPLDAVIARLTDRELDDEWVRQAVGAYSEHFSRDFRLYWADEAPSD